MRLEGHTPHVSPHLCSHLLSPVIRSHKRRLNEVGGVPALPLPGPQRHPQQGDGRGVDRGTAALQAAARGRVGASELAGHKVKGSMGCVGGTALPKRPRNSQTAAGAGCRRQRRPPASRPSPSQQSHLLPPKVPAPLVKPRPRLCHLRLGGARSGEQGPCDALRRRAVGAGVEDGD